MAATVERAENTMPNTQINVGKHWQVKHVIIPFSNTATVETSTAFKLPSRCIVLGVEIEVTTAVASGTIDVGTLSTGTNGDADGFVDGRSTAATGFVAAAGSDANTIGVFLEGAEQTGSNTKLYKGFPSTDEREVTYTTSDHASVGYIHILYSESNYA